MFVRAFSLQQDIVPCFLTAMYIAGRECEVYEFVGLLFLHYFILCVTFI